MAPNYIDFIIITSSAIKGFSKPTFVLKGSVREGLLYRRLSALVCAHHAHGGESAGSLLAHTARLGGSLAKSRAARSLATLPASLWPRCPACSSASPRSQVDGLHQLEDELFPVWRGDDTEQGDVLLRESSSPRVLPKSTVEFVLIKVRTWFPLPRPRGSTGIMVRTLTWCWELQCSCSPQTAPSQPGEHPTSFEDMKHISRPMVSAPQEGCITKSSSKNKKAERPSQMHHNCRIFRHKTLWLRTSAVVN